MSMSMLWEPLGDETGTSREVYPNKEIASDNKKMSLRRTLRTQTFLRMVVNVNMHGKSSNQINYKSEQVDGCFFNVMYCSVGNGVLQ